MRTVLTYKYITATATSTLILRWVRALEVGILRI